MKGFQSGKRGQSVRTAQTAWGGAAMVMVVLTVVGMLLSLLILFCLLAVCGWNLRRLLQ